ncbi:oligogalacturonate lyase family protein [Paenibacillus radicis (ex Xue et al. 2023)]|uniref:Oligogalacturonate lyase family protein n=1 Tax=Paenibacillus radicis (ex Xue et al. 2023) TaxID=2972489 RepID=A0ABT1YBU4_9BACL|nr:oligogalacturonate lyase family protein [Paenibacillus radicis (ex Xue et al. 2023)]MCR8630372.1 oligogalacturonate lyase family protein [Paenibacillus radicis (ex Xue et al. 2023)]
MMMKGNITKHTMSKAEENETGRLVTRLTSLPGNHHHLYFTSSSFTANNRQVLFISDMVQGNPNLYKLSLEDGETVQLSDNRNGIMKSYVYYDGKAYQGLAKASPSYSAATNRLLYIQDHKVILIDVETLESEMVYALPAHVMTGFTHLSACGRYACIPYLSSEAFEVGSGNPFTLIRDRVADRRLESKVLVIDMQTGVAEPYFSHQGWITHVQFHPEDHRTILFNHEGGMVDQRIWLYRNGRIEKVRDQSNQSNSLWVCHEMWSKDGSTILYHGTRGIPNDPSMKRNESTEHAASFVGTANLSDGTYSEIEFPQHMTAYGHFTVGNDLDLLLTDGIIDAQSIHLCRTDWLSGQLTYERICHHHSSFTVQDVHPHPIFSHDDRYVLFSSDAHNEREKGHLYLVELDEAGKKI